MQSADAVDEAAVRGVVGGDAALGCIVIGGVPSAVSCAAVDAVVIGGVAVGDAVVCAVVVAPAVFPMVVLQ